MKFPDFKNELKAISDGYHFVLGCDEVGVSPLAGPVVAAACILDPSSIGKYRSKSKWYYRVRDSKTTNEEERQILLKEILEHTLHFGRGVVWPEEIDKINIHKASLEAMRRATAELFEKMGGAGENRKALIYIDGRFKIPDIGKRGITLDQKSVISGDCKILSISAASIIAKVHRDGIMRELDAKFPEYGFAKHKGYPTREHQDAIRRLGAAPVHRRSFLKKVWTAKTNSAVKGI